MSLIRICSKYRSFSASIASKRHFSERKSRHVPWMVVAARVSSLRCRSAREQQTRKRQQDLARERQRAAAQAKQAGK